MTLRTRWDGGQYGAEVREGEHLCVHRADSLHCAAQTSTMSIIKWPCVRVPACAQSCLTLHSPMDYSHPGSSPGNFPGENAGVGCHFLRQGVFPTQGSNPHLLSLLKLAGGLFTTLPRRKHRSNYTPKWGRKKDLTYTWFSNGPLPFQSHDLGQIHRLEKCTLYFDKLHFKKTAIVR